MELNNKGFAITTALYGIFILFLLLSAASIGMLATYKIKLNKLTTTPIPSEASCSLSLKNGVVTVTSENTNVSYSFDGGTTYVTSNSKKMECSSQSNCNYLIYIKSENGNVSQCGSVTVDMITKSKKLCSDAEFSAKAFSIFSIPQSGTVCDQTYVSKLCGNGYDVACSKAYVYSNSNFIGYYSNCSQQMGTSNCGTTMYNGESICLKRTKMLMTKCNKYDGKEEKEYVTSCSEVTEIKYKVTCEGVYSVTIN